MEASEISESSENSESSSIELLISLQIELNKKNKI